MARVVTGSSRVPLAIILTIVAVDAAGIALIFPILPNLLRDITGTEQVSGLFGQTLALYALPQFIFAPVLGVLSDRYGRRPVLLLSLAGSTIDYLIMAFAPALWMLLLGRTLAGLTASTAAVTTAYISDITPGDQRARRFGFFQACFGAGFVIGPLIGGSLGQFWWREPILAAAVLNGINLTLALFFLPESHHATERKPINWGAMNPLRSLRWAFSIRALVPLLTVFLLVSFAAQTYGTVWVLFVDERFDWTAAEIGVSLGMFGVLVVLVQAFLVGPMVKHLGETGTVLIGIASGSAALFGLAFVEADWILFLLIPLISFSSVGTSALRSLQTKVVEPENQGKLQGVVASMVGLAAVLGPLLFSEVFAFSLPNETGIVWLIGVGIYATAVPIVLAASRRAARAAEATTP